MYSNREGIILVNKPEGATSHDVVDFIRKRFRIKKVGHAGTLDPMATGLLIILLGSFTKKSLSFSSLDKEYEAIMRLGISTDTGDKEGNVLEERDPGLFSESIKNIDDILSCFQGSIMQVPPMFSAKKVNGKKLYELARRGVSIKREPVSIVIKEIKRLSKDGPLVKIYVKCSKGTYIRQLAHDIGEKIGCGAHLVGLERIGIGDFSVRDALSAEEIKGEEKKFDENILQP